MPRNKLLAKFDLLERSRQKLLSGLNQLDEKVLKYKPAPDKWSITQILYHLHLAESRSMSYVKKKMLGGDSLKKTGIIATIRSTFLKWLLQSGYKWKAPQVLGDVPEELNYHEVINNWNETRNQLKTLIESIPDHLTGRELYRHPRAGRLNLKQMMDFFQDHFDHHLIQVKRLRERTH